MTECSRASKRYKMATSTTTTTTRTTTTTTTTMLDTMDDNILQHIVSYFDQADRLQLATVCKSLCAAVEAYSATIINNICSEHHADERFLNRVRATFLTSGTTMIPSRCLLQRAQTVYLYKLKVFRDVDDLHCRTAKMLISEDGNRLLILVPATNQVNGAINNRLYIVDLRTRCVVRQSELSLRVPQHYLASMSWNPTIFWMEKSSKIVVCTCQQILVLNAETLEPTLAHDFENRDAKSFVQRDSSTILFNDKRRTIHSFSVLTGVVVDLRTLDVSLGNWRIVLVSKNKRWLLVRLLTRKFTTGGDILHVLDMLDGFRLQTSLKVHHHDDLVTSSDYPNKIFCHHVYQQEIRVLQLDESTGTLSGSHSFPTEVQHGKLEGIVGGEGLFLQWRGTEGRRGPGAVSVYDPFTGHLRRDLRGITQMHAMVSNKREVLLTNWVNGEGFMISAYLPKKDFY